MHVASSGHIQLPSGFEVVEVGYSDIYPLAEEICRHAADVVVLDPADLRKAVLAGLTAVAGSARSSGPPAPPQVDQGSAA